MLLHNQRISNAQRLASDTEWKVSSIDKILGDSWHVYLLCIALSCQIHKLRRQFGGYASYGIRVIYELWKERESKEKSEIII